MATKKIYIVRHGQTDYNLKGIVQGSGIDAPINSYGQEQAKAFFEAHKHIAFDKVYYTALQRTRQSIAGFLELGIPSESLPEMNEISWGKYEGVPMTHDENQYYLHMLEKWASGDLDYAIAGGESPNMVKRRLKKGLKKILQDGEETVLLCMHGRAMRMLLSVMLHYPLQYMDLFEHQNLCCYELTLMGNLQFRLDRYNDTSYLE
ncbi:histidine phosphatase family protein [Litoribacter ruber]|uniref:Histidine phosphatase family protein n=1 Tax=Litoribacter ruber TaxID=702568 RepID=A0AAP2CHC6_9BACT|nr:MULTISPECIES: histidine phosphatase family protein [Litoribacter]MBS9524718.1 histidine phosphatase family protein [Litoribacter alkaliphilus]MBT0812738.1 histidine phosphatase family protein [Litoribacter ruber]